MVNVTSKVTAAPSVVTAAWGATIASKTIAKSLAKRNGHGSVTLYLYSFKTLDTYPPGDDDFFLEAIVSAGGEAELVPGEYSSDKLSLVLHTNASNFLFSARKGSIVITDIGHGKIKGVLKIDDGSTKVSGAFDMDLV